jgi:hypothetical protein
MPDEIPVVTTEPYILPTVEMVDGQLVLNDPAAVGMIKAVGKHNCKNTLEINADRVQHFKRRITERGSHSGEMVIVLLNVDDPNGAFVANILLPNMNWQEIRDRGEIPFARGLALREGIQKMVDALDREVGERLEKAGTAVVVMDHGVVEVFEV